MSSAAFAKLAKLAKLFKVVPAACGCPEFWDVGDFRFGIIM